MPDTATARHAGRSGQRLRQTAETMPMIMPKATDQTMLAIVSTAWA